MLGYKGQGSIADRGSRHYPSLVVSKRGNAKAASQSASNQF